MLLNYNIFDILGKNLDPVHWVQFVQLTNKILPRQPTFSFFSKSPSFSFILSLLISYRICKSTSLSVSPLMRLTIIASCSAHSSPPSLPSRLRRRHAVNNGDGDFIFFAEISLFHLLLRDLYLVYNARSETILLHHCKWWIRRRSRNLSSTMLSLPSSHLFSATTNLIFL